MNKKLGGFLLIIIFVFGYTVFEALRLDSKFADQSTIATGTIIKMLPDVRFSLLSDDSEINVRDYTKDGDFVLVHFWATWCAPCEAEFPELVSMMQSLKSKQNIKFLLVAVNDDKTAMKKFLKKYDLNLDSVVLLSDNIESHKAFGTYKMPESFLFDGANNIVKKFTGQQPWSENYLLEYLRSL